MGRKYSSVHPGEGEGRPALSLTGRGQFQRQGGRSTPHSQVVSFKMETTHRGNMALLPESFSTIWDGI